MRRSIWKFFAMCLALIVSVGGTIAYLTDTQKAVNVATLGNIKIELIEQERDTSGNLVPFQNNHMLLPAVIKGNLAVDHTTGFWQNVRNTMDKVVSVKNTGNSPAYIRLWFAFEVPENVTCTEYLFADMIQLNVNNIDWEWEFLRTAGRETVFELDDSYYVVCVATYPYVLEAGDTTPASLREVMMYDYVTSYDIASLGEKYSIFVVAQGVQAQGFDSAEEALTGGFGDVTAANHPFAGMSETDAPNDNPNDPPAIPDISDIPESPVEDFEWEVNAEGTEITIMSYTGKATGVRIPQIINNLPVTKIENFDIYYGWGESVPSPVEILILPEGITDISWNAFDYCYNLKQISLPDSLLSIDDYAFQHCNGLTDVNIPKNVSNLSPSAFSGCMKLQNINVHTENSNYASIDGVLFSKDKKTLLTYPCGRTGAYSVPDGVTELGDYSFEFCRLSAISMPDSVKRIGEYAFYECQHLTSVELSSNLEITGVYPFSGCNQLKRIEIPSSMNTNEPFWAFGKSMLEVNIHQDNAFYTSRDGVVFSKDMKTLIYYPVEKEGAYIIPDGVTTIRAGAMGSITGLTSITIPASMTEIDNWEFSGCSSLTEIHVHEDNAVFSSNEGALFSKDGKTLLCCPPGRSGHYSVPDGVTTISAYAFRCDGLSKITLPDSLTTIQVNAFYSGHSLKELSIPKNASILQITSGSSSIPGEFLNLVVTVYENSPAHRFFQKGGWLRASYQVQDSAGNILSTVVPKKPDTPESAFTWIENADGRSVTITKYSGSDTTVRIPQYIDGKRVTDIGSSAFRGCATLTTLTMTNLSSPHTIISIGDYAFEGCTGLTQIYIPALEVGDYAFANCSNLEVVSSEFYIERIGENAFQNCAPSLKFYFVSPENFLWCVENGFLFYNING